jgi:hypothetical protein
METIEALIPALLKELLKLEKTFPPDSSGREVQPAYPEVINPIIVPGYEKYDAPTIEHHLKLLLTRGYVSDGGVRNGPSLGIWFAHLTDAGHLMINDNQVTSEARRRAKYAEWDRIGLDRVKADLIHNNGRSIVGGGLQTIHLAWEWVHEREADESKSKMAAGNTLEYIAESRINELRALKSPDFDFVKLIRLCEEINLVSASGSLFARAMLTRAILDHVPPLFKATTFAEVANNYGRGGRSFKEAMLNLENASRKISDGHLHMQIRPKETLPTTQQVDCREQTDLLLSEIVRVFK